MWLARPAQGWRRLASVGPGAPMGHMSPMQDAANVLWALATLAWRGSLMEPLSKQVVRFQEPAMRHIWAHAGAI